MIRRRKILEVPPEEIRVMDSLGEGWTVSMVVSGGGMDIPGTVIVYRMEQFEIRSWHGGHDHKPVRVARWVDDEETVTPP